MIMLSYMRQDNENDVTVEDDRQTSQTDQTPRNPDDIEQNYLLPTNTQRSVKRGTIALLALFVTGLLLLIFMVKRTNPVSAQAATEENAIKIDQAVASLAGIRKEMDGKLGNTVREMSTLSDIQQVGVGELKKNPFRHRSVRQIDDIRLDEKLNMSDRQPVTENDGTLYLWTIISSEKERSCMINDKILYEGDSIDGLRVESIGKDFVQLVGHRAQVILRISK